MQKQSKPGKKRAVYLVDGCRTPFIKALGRNPWSAATLGVTAAQTLLLRQPMRASELSEVIVGCVAPAPEEVNIARLIALRLGCGSTVPAWTVQRNCASGLQAIDAAVRNIALGKSELVLAGGTEAMSRSPVLCSDALVEWLATLSAAKTLSAKLKLLAKLRYPMFIPVIGLLKGLTDWTVNLSMGQTAEKLAYIWGIDRKIMDAYSVESHKRSLAAKEQGHFSYISSLYDYQGQFFNADTGIRADSTVEKLAKLKPAFDRPFGLVTAANSSQVTDGAAMVLLASEAACERYKLPVLARLTEANWAGVDPALMGIGPAHAISDLLLEHKLTLADIDYFEINEAFAAQVLACVAALNDAPYCKEHLGLSTALGQIDLGRLNIDGGAIALGHPVGASGARLVLQMAHILKRQNAKRGIASLCIGGGQGGAMLIENCSGEA